MTSPHTATGTDPGAGAFAGVSALLVAYLDNAGITRSKLIPQARLGSAATSGATISRSVASLLAVDDEVLSTQSIDAAIGDLRCIPDLDALALLDRERGLAWAPSDLCRLDGSSDPTCQRTALKNVVADATSLGLDPTVGFELEFSVFRGTKDDPVLAHAGPGYGNNPFLDLESFHLGLLEALATAGVPASQLHPEYGNGQLEVSLEPTDPVSAADQFLLARFVIARTARDHGLLVSFAPVAVPGEATNGCHIHLSARQEGQNVFHDPDAPSGMGVAGERMTAGVLAHVGDAVALLGGSVLSFTRLRPHSWAGSYICWGEGNREASVRYMAGQVGREDAQANIELKVSDAAANPYLAVATFLAMALDGVTAKRALSPGIDVDPDSLTAPERAERGVRTFPSDLGQALDALQSSELVARTFHPLLLEAYLAVRRHEWTAYGHVPADEVAARLRFRY
jgi:glutamine synthetase